MTDIRPEIPADHAAIGAIMKAAFGQGRERDHGDEVVELVEAIRASEHYRRDLALVAVDGDTVVGFVMASHAVLVDAGTRRRTLTLSPLGVAPERHRQGIGTALVEALAATATDAGDALLILEGDPRYYSRLGFEPAAEHGITIPLPDWAPPQAAQVRRLPAYDPALRGRLEYPAAFDAVAAH